jgi:hypothetical protein
MKKKILNYICEVNFPNTSAYSIHVAKICDAFATEKLIVNLFVPNSTINNKEIKKIYNLKNIINVKSIFKKKTRLNFFFILIFVIKIIFLQKKEINKEHLYLTRSILFGIIGSIFFKNIILELHHEPIGFTGRIFYFFKKIKIINRLRFILIHKNLIDKIKPKLNYFICLDDGVNIDDFKINESKKKYKNTCVYIGSFHKGKGFNLIRQLSIECPKIKFHLYGDLNFLQNKISRKNLKFFNYIEYKLVPKILSKYEVAIMPYEKIVGGRSKNLNITNNMSPIKMFDYLASKKIILATNLKVYNHILKNKFNSILINSENILEWKKNIIDIFQNTRKYKYLKYNAFNTAKKFTWNNRVKKILVFFNKSLNAK